MLSKMTRLLALLLAATLTFGTLSPVAAFATEGDEPPVVEEPLLPEDPAGDSPEEPSSEEPSGCEAGDHSWADANCMSPKTCSACGTTEGEALGHAWETQETKKVCTVCGAEEEIPVEPVAPILEEELTVEDYATFLAELKVLEGYAVEFAASNSKYSDPNLLVANFIRTGVDRYNDGNWKTLAGEEITVFTSYVEEQDQSNGTTAMRLRNIVVSNFILPNGNQTDFGHMFGTMNISYVTNVQSADLGGWAGDICDLLTYSHNHGNVPAGTIDEMTAYILENCFGVDAKDAMGWDDFYGDMDAFYLSREWKGSGKKLSSIMEAYFTAQLDDEARSAYFLNNRFTGLKTQADVREAVYTTYKNNLGIQVLEAGRDLVDVDDLRQAACYAFADYVYAKGGDQLTGEPGEDPDPDAPETPDEPEDPSTPSEPEEVENPYYEDFSVSKTFLAPGISQSIHYAQSADNKQMVYYVATVDVTRDDVTIMANYRNADPTQGWGMSRVMDQAEALMKKHTNPADEKNYIENFNVVVATNGDGYNMSTGEPGGLLVMGGVEYHPVDRDGFFAILKDGTAMIGSREDYAIYKDQIQDAIGGFGATLVKEGKIVASADPVSTRASRTAIGITASGAVVMMVLDGRQEPFSCGGTMAEIAQIMYEAGCVHAINLDGGGSTTYASKPEGADSLRLVNRPSDGYARSVAASLVAVSTAKASKEFDHATVTTDYEYLTIGTSINASAVGVSASGNAAPIPEGATWTVSDETIGSITPGTGVFTALENGDVEIRLVQDGEVLGSKTVHVVVPDAIAFEKEKINAIYGVPVTIPLNVSYNGNPVAYNDNDVWILLEDESAGTLEGNVLTGNEESGVRSVMIGALLLADVNVQTFATINLYKDGEAFFDFDDITGGSRQLAWKRGVSNSTSQDAVVYNIDDPTKPMGITYVFGLDMESIEIPAQLADLVYMLPGADVNSTAWSFLLQLAERISVLTEVKIVAQFDQNLVLDISELSVMNEYFRFESAELNEETNELTVICKWIDQTASIDPATANPTCILSGIKATPKDGGWNEAGKMNIVNTGTVSYRVYMRSSSLYSFAQSPANQANFGLQPYSTSETGYEGGTESGASFGSTYAEYEDHFTLDKSLKNGWFTYDDQMFYYVNHEALTGIQQVPSYEDASVKLFYDFGEDGACTGKITGIFDHDGGKKYAIRGELMTDWRSVYDPVTGESHFYWFDLKTGKAVNGVQTIRGYNFTFEDYKLVRGDLVTDSNGTRYRWATGWIHGQWFEVDGNLYHTAKYETYVTTGFKHIVGQDLEYAWHLFDENGIFQKDFSGIYKWGNDYVLLEKGVMIQEPGLVFIDGYYYYFCSTGKAVTSCTYWPSKTNGLLPMGPYVFDEFGRMTNPPTTDPENPGTPDTPTVPDQPVEKKNGIYKVNGNWYYFVDDAIQYCAGLVQLNNEDGTVSYIYVRSNGQLAVGNYWTTNHNNILPETIYNFGEDGIMTNPPAAKPEEPETPEQPEQPENPTEPEKPVVKEGIIKEGGVLYYYENGTRAYSKGLVKLEDGSYIYVRSNGALAIGSYWTTNDNGLLPQKLYTFGEDGKMIDAPASKPAEPGTPDQPDVPTEPETPEEPEKPVVKEGIVVENGVMYYYENGIRAYDKGLMKLTDEEGRTYYMYVRSNAQVATGKYWPTNNHGLLPAATYDFGTDGRYYPA